MSIENKYEKIRVLFICSGNYNNKPGVVVYNQAMSLGNENVIVEFFLIKGKGFWGYVRNIGELRSFIQKNKFHIFHAHYAFSGFVASLAGCRPLVVSLMGSDLEGSFWISMLTRFFSKVIWREVILKSTHMREKLNLKTSIILPNGVDINFFNEIYKSEAIKKSGFHSHKKHVLFLANPFRPEKNVKLAKEAFEMCNYPESELNIIFDVDHAKIPYYLNSSDVLLLTSVYEGSPNIIKEAMACNIPIVSTDVGDVKKLLDGIEGCYITTFCAKDVALKLRLALCFNRRTKGREAIITYGLNSEKTAKLLYEIYLKMKNSKCKEA